MIISLHYHLQPQVKYELFHKYFTSFHSSRELWTQWIDLAPNVWLHSSVGRESHRYRGSHGFESRWSPDFFTLLLSNCLNRKLSTMIFTFIYNPSSNMNFFHIYFTSKRNCTGFFLALQSQGSCLVLLPGRVQGATSFLPRARCFQFQSSTFIYGVISFLVIAIKLSDIKQLLDDVEHDIMNYQNRGLSYLPKPKAEADNTDTRFW